MVDLGASPLANSILTDEQLHQMEPTYPLCVYVCCNCYLVQIEEFESPEHLFSDYSYFSSFAISWLEHCEHYAVRMIERLTLGPGSKVVEIASNDGYLLQYFVRAGIPVLGIEPAANVAEAAIAKGIPTEVMFFGRETAAKLAGDEHGADLIVANNVLAHVPDINGFVEGLKRLLKPAGVITVEFPHLLNLIQQAQFDTIYHEHFSYLSLSVVERIFAHHGLTVFDVEQLPTHGGSLRIYAAHADDTDKPVSENVEGLRNHENAAGLNNVAVYRPFQGKVLDVKIGLLRFLTEARQTGRTVAGYGAPAKGNTLLNYCGVGPELLPYTVDISPHKQDRFLPGTRIPIHAPDAILEGRPDYLLILPWNLKDEIAEQMVGIREWGGKFVVAIPRVNVF